MSRVEEIKELHQILLHRRDSLKRAIAGDWQLLKDLRTSSEEDASEAAQQDISSQLVEVETRELNKIENALDRMQLGKYGKCELCDGHIALPRLQALPYATFCFSCQTEKEKND